MNHLSDPGRERLIPKDGAAPEWAWPPTPDDLASIASIDVEAFVRGDDDVKGIALRPAGGERAWLSSSVIRPRRFRAVLPLAAASVIAAGTWAMRTPVVTPSVSPQALVAQAPPTPPAHVVDTPQAVARTPVRPLPVAVPRVPPVRQRAGTLPRAVGNGRPTRQVEPPASVTTRGVAATPANTPSPSVSPASMTRAAAPPPPPAARAAHAASVLAGSAIDDAAPAAVLPMAPPEAGTPVPNDDEPSIRDVLHRYGSAYSRLDAAAARAVWPAVDARALERAFAGLQSQQVRLGDCRVSLDRTSQVASATCTGSQAWVPRVGDPAPRVESREWRFRLSRASRSGWRIDSVQSR